MTDTQKTRSNKPALIAAGVVVAMAAITVMFILPAETGYDPTGVGKATGLVKIADPDNAELERGLKRMETQEVLLLSDTPPAPEPGATDVWEVELAPFDAVEFKYTMPEGGRMAFRWEGSDVLNYDMHSHPFEGGVEMTESFSVDAAKVMQGVYIAPFDGIHGWYWQNRTLDNVTLKLETSGAFTHSTIYGAGAPLERPIEGVEASVEGTAAGHEMQNTE
ncbi:hypothetical protein GCM10009127_25700 [Alteraurantiacibacter aestuarii]|uniref:hypothetical protein n=1 Tax=Alteraurantiacibacter aestuarii TaxID=650004 RepID=UPI0031E2E539